MSIQSRIRQLLAEQEMTPNAASVKAGLPRDAIRDILSGKSQYPRADTIMKVARAFDVSPADLMDIPAGGIPTERLLGSEFDLPIRYAAAAGAWLAVDELHDEPLGIEKAIKFPQFDGIEQWLEQARGDSLNRLIPDGGLAHVVSAIGLQYEPRQDDVVVVVRTRAQGAFVERTLKQIDIVRGKIELWPRSFNPRWSEPLQITDAQDDPDETTVEIAGLVIRGYMPLWPAR